MDCHSCNYMNRNIIIWNMSQEIRNLLAKNIQKFRKIKNLKREELSLLLGFDNSYISKLEKGKINITVDKLDLIANHLGIKVKDLFDFE